MRLKYNAVYAYLMKTHNKWNKIIKYKKIFYNLATVYTLDSTRYRKYHDENIWWLKK